MHGTFKVEISPQSLLKGHQGNLEDHNSVIKRRTGTVATEIAAQEVDQQVFFDAPTKMY